MNADFWQVATEENAIRNIQRYLRQLSYFEPTIGNIIIDGIYRTSTRNGVSAYQRIKGFEVTGVTDRKTWDALYSDYLKCLDRNSSGDSISPFFDLPNDYELVLGASNALVRLIELMLEEISSVYTILAGTFEVNGVFDSDKQNAISEYQKINRLSVTGNIDKQTWDRLASDYNLILRKNASQ